MLHRYIVRNVVLVLMEHSVRSVAKVLHGHSVRNVCGFLEDIMSEVLPELLRKHKCCRSVAWSPAVLHVAW